MGSVFSTRSCKDPNKASSGEPLEEMSRNRLATPPTSASSHFLTPPNTIDTASKELSVSQVVNEFCIALYEGTVPPSEDWTKSFNISPGEYLQFRNLLKRRLSVDAFIDDKVRLDYNPKAKTGQLVFRMASVEHDVFLINIAKHWEHEIDILGRRYPWLKPHLNAIERGGGAFEQEADSWFYQEGIHNPQEDLPGLRCPDAWFTHHSAACIPMVILEVSRTQTTTSLSELATSYVFGTEGQVRAIVGLDLYHGPRDSKEGWIDLWRTDMIQGYRDVRIRKVMDHVPFRTATGEPVPGVFLNLRLSDFLPCRNPDGTFSESARIPREICRRLASMHILTSSTDLCDMLAAAEEMKRREGNFTPLCYEGLKPDLLLGPGANEVFADRQEQEAYEMRRASERLEAAPIWRVYGHP